MGDKTFLIFELKSFIWFSLFYLYFIQYVTLNKYRHYAIWQHFAESKNSATSFAIKPSADLFGGAVYACGRNYSKGVIDAKSSWGIAM